MMCQRRHFLSKFLIFRTFSAYHSYKLHSYKKKSVKVGQLIQSFLSLEPKSLKNWKLSCKSLEKCSDPRPTNNDNSLALLVVSLSGLLMKSCNAC